MASSGGLTDEVFEKALGDSIKDFPHIPSVMKFAWRTETMVLPDHKVAITEQSQDC